MRKHKLFALPSSTLILLLLASCSPAASPPAKPAATTAATVATPATKTVELVSPTPAREPPADQPRYGDILTVSVAADPANFDIHQEGSIAVLELLVPAYDSLVQSDLRTGAIVSGLAEKWEMSADGLNYTFSLRKGIKFHDGKPMTSQDAKLSMDRQKDPPKNIRSARQEQFNFVDRIEAPDDSTVRIVMKQVYMAFMAQFATDWFVIYPKHVVEAKGDMKRDVVGTGPFKFKSYASGVSLELTKNPDYFPKGLPYLDGITHYIIKDPATRFSALRTGRVHMSGHNAHLSSAEGALLKAQNIAVWKYPALAGPRYPINSVKPPFNDVRLRQAVGLAYDRQTAVKVLYEGDAKIGTFLPPGEWGFSEEEIHKLPGFRQPKDADRAEAKKLLAEAGFPDGFKMTLLVRALRPDMNAGEYMRDQLAAIGITAAIEVQETVVFNAHTRSFNFQIASQMNTWRINDPDELGRKYLTGAAQNYGGWGSKRFDQVFEEQTRTVDTVKRKALTREMDKILMQEYPDLVPLWVDYVLATLPAVKNFGAPPGHYTGMRYADIWLAK